MVATYQTSINGRRNLGQVSVAVGASEVNTDVLIPIREAGTGGQAMGGLLLALTYPAGSPAPADCLPDENDQVCITRILPSDTASVNVIFRSINRESGTVRFSSPVMTITQPAFPDTNVESPIFVGYPGDLVVVSSDVACTVLMTNGVIDRWGAGWQS
jgi:hypothetical protein